ncbi:outer membrane lipoprotein LolB [Wohlfahrtiimonas chitiniclastica]|uniref:lipoprotein insertase outer membrane protein LolB n=1 Tax=Wohlfahrtiimonas chitiniclastica TaxID=400946 RepID=UPI001BD07543|nr:lipoprotein insertase outer membrane protein LolB [Wohlfahrtiimonas chitiniclastica]MBS7820622.1 outer membrane lipoprotein LolB [Wohlfahrtiimonas chitiniclastica]
MSIKRLGLAAAAMLIITGCATHIPDQNQPLESYTAIGRAALKAPNNSGQASFNWQQISPENLKVIIQGPLGSGRIDLVVTPTESTLKTDDQTYKSESPDVLFSEITGFDWPISGMTSWIVGEPGAASTLVKRDAQNRIESFDEDGWHVEYKKWGHYKQRDIPKTIELTRDNVRLRLLVEHWLY